MDVPVFLAHIPCGFPSPADDFREPSLDLNELVILHPDATFLVRVSGDSMKQAGIHDGDIIVVDRAITPVHASIIVARLNDKFTVKRLYLKGESVYLLPANSHYQPIKITSELDFEVWGVVVAVVHLFVRT